MTTSPRKEHGFALVVVIMVLLLVTALAAEMIFTVRTGVQETRQAKLATASRGLAKGGINLGLFYLTDTPLKLDDNTLYTPGVAKTTYLDSGKIRFQVIPESGKININKINRPLLSQFLSQMGYEPDEQEIFIDSLQDWTDKDNLHRLNGAERDFYEDLTPPYQPANGPFSDPSEIFMVRGAEKLIGVINPGDFFTTYNPKGKLNFNSLSREMLAVMTDHDQEQIDHYFELKEENKLLNAVQGQLVLGDNYATWKPHLVYNKAKNRYYTIIAAGYAGQKQPDDDGENSHQYTAGVTIRLLLSAAGNSFRYLRWSEEASVDHGLE
jgi:general secretion pathway protein K